MSKNHLTYLEQIEEIVEVKLVSLSAGIKEKIGPELSILAERNSKKINVYRMIYISQGHKVIGYIVEPKKGENLPCVIYNRGGSSDFGSLKLGQLFLDLSRFAQAGYVSLFSQYSGNVGGEGTDEMGGSEIEDILQLYTILKKYQTADESRVGMYGASRGGMMTYLTLAKVDWIKAAVIVAGVADLVQHKDFRPEIDNRYTSMFGDSIEERKKRSVLYWVDTLPKNVPLLIMHGTADWRVNPLDSIRMAEELLKNKIPYRLVMFEGANHALTEYKAEANEMVFQWFDRFVKNNEPLPNILPHGK